MEWAIALLVVAVLGVAAAIAAGGVGEMSSDPVQDQYRQDLPDTALTADDLQGVRFGVALRGYAMDQVDDVLARLSHEIAERDAVIAELQGVDTVQDTGRIAELSGTDLGDDSAPTEGAASRTGAGEVAR